MNTNARDMSNTPEEQLHKYIQSLLIFGLHRSVVAAFCSSKNMHNSTHKGINIYITHKIVKMDDKRSFSYPLNRLVNEREASFRSHTIPLAIQPHLYELKNR